MQNISTLCSHSSNQGKYNEVQATDYTQLRVENLSFNFFNTS